MLDAKEIDEIRKSIIDGVDAAKRGGIVCGYPETITVERLFNNKKITVTYPIWNTPDTSGLK